MKRYASYIICGTPRSGSTLLCGLLTESGVAGRPNSYFRQPGIPDYARRWGVPPPSGPDDVAFDRAYLQAMLREGRGGTDIFGLRIMWGSVSEAAARLAWIGGEASNIPARFAKAFGPTLYIHLSRVDKVAQAVSLLRAEQSGVWHLRRDGTVLEGADSANAIAYDGDRIGALLAELEADDAAWAAFFAEHGIEPLRLVYETMTADPQAALAHVLAALGQDPERAKAARVRTAKMADATSLQWADRFRQERGSGA